MAAERAGDGGGARGVARPARPLVEAMGNWSVAARPPPQPVSRLPLAPRRGGGRRRARPPRGALLLLDSGQLRPRPAPLRGRSAGREVHGDLGLLDGWSPLGEATLPEGRVRLGLIGLDRPIWLTGSRRGLTGPLAMVPLQARSDPPHLREPTISGPSADAAWTGSSSSSLLRRGPASAPVPEVSVVVPSLNSGRYIGAAIRSALEQPGPPVEVIVQDGGSSDETPAVVASFGDPRVTLHREDDGGQADALNRGIARARGRWIVWLNADDMLAPGALAAAAGALREDWEVVYGDFHMIDVRGRVVKRYGSPELDRARLLTRGLYVFSGSLLVRRDVYARLGGYDPDLHYCMDYDFLLRLAPQVRARHCGAVLSYFREQPESKTSRHAARFFRETVMVRRRHGASRGGSSRSRCGARSPTGSTCSRGRSGAPRLPAPRAPPPALVSPPRRARRPRGARARTRPT